MTKRATMPIQVSGKMDLSIRRGEKVVAVTSIPWEMIEGETSERQSQRNHDQSLETIASRGGFGASEAIAVMACMRWHDLGGDENSHRILYAMRALFERGKRIAEACRSSGEVADHKEG